MKRVLLAYGGLGLLLWPVPLLNVLQAESSAVVAFVSFFVAGWAALAAFEREEPLSSVLGKQEVALLVPLAMLTGAQLWAPNCTFRQGLLFYVLFPGVTVVFAVAMAYAISGTSVSHPYLLLGGLGIVISIAGPIYDLGWHPQFYTYNHVFGAVLGPIYDEQLAVRPGLFWFRGLTLLWAGLLVGVGARLRGKGIRGVVPAVALALGAVYLFSTPLGINTTASRLQAELGGHRQTAHFDLYYDPDRMTRGAVQALVADHEAAYAYIQKRLRPDSSAHPERIQSYIYPSPDVKGRLTGARTTSVSPVWLGTPQVHLLRSRAEASLGHELAHVFSRPYGLPGLKASWAPGLVEGWAVALEPPSPAPSPDALVSVATVGAEQYLRTQADALASRLTPWGFWTGRGAVSYATMGSFVTHLLEQNGPEPLKDVYDWGQFEAAYGRSLPALAADWAGALRSASMLPIGTYDVVARRFSRPSLFETECPHYVPPYRRHLQAADKAKRAGDTTRVRRHLDAALSAHSRSVAAQVRRARLRLAKGRTEAAHRQLDTLAAALRTPAIQATQADAQVLGGRADSARALYRKAFTGIARYDHETRMKLLLRRAVADQPSIVRILASGDSAKVQARRLRTLDLGPAGTAWRALRLQEAHAYAEAAALWASINIEAAVDWPIGWRQEWAVQRRAWWAEAATRSGKGEVGARAARSGAEAARKIGAREWAATLEWWAWRADARIRSSP